MNVSLIFFSFLNDLSFLCLDELEAWSAKQLVKKFKSLTLNKIAYEKIGYLKPKDYEEIKKKDQ